MLTRNEWFLQASRPPAAATMRSARSCWTSRSARRATSRPSSPARVIQRRRPGAVLERSRRDADYLLAPDVPATLLEMGFITNPDDNYRQPRGPRRPDTGRRRLFGAPTRLAAR